MTSDTGADPKNLAVQLIETVWNEGNVEAIDELIAEDYVEHTSTGAERHGPGELKNYVEEVRSGLSNFTKSIEDVLVDGNKVVIRYGVRALHDSEFKGFAPTGNEVDVTGIIIYRIDGGEITEAWENSDTFGLLEQIGAT